jgi:hypothetical protein
MASLTLEQAAEAPKIRKQYRVCYREPDGTVCFESVNDTEGSELLFVHPDGSTFSEVIVGLCSPCAYGDGCGLGDRCPSGWHGLRRGVQGSGVVDEPDPVPVAAPAVGVVPEKWLGSGPKRYVRPSDAVPVVAEPEPKNVPCPRPPGPVPLSPPPSHESVWTKT